MINFDHLTPTSLRMTLAASLFLIIAAAAAIFYFANSSLKQVATSVSHKVADAEASRNNLTNLKSTQKFLKENKTSIERVNSIVAESKSYQYQDQIIIDLNAYAAKAGIAITSINFGTGAVAGAAPAATSTPPTGQTAAPAASTTTGAVKSTTVSVSVANPVDYNNLLRFVKSIEQNLTKMQISSISLSKGDAGNAVSTDTLNIEVYIR